MTDRDALVRAILEVPDDDAPRLVFADWLDDHGWVAEGTGLRRAVHQSVTEWELFERGIPLGLYPPARLPDWGSRSYGWARLRRGFVEGALLNPSEFLPIAGDLFAAHPVTDVGFWEVRPVWDYWGWHWRWESDGGWPKQGGHILPAAVFDFLDRPTDGGWPTEEAAFEALSRACVRYGRQLVGLSPLRWA